MSATTLRVPKLSPALVAQLLAEATLPVGAYNIRLRRAPSGAYEVFVDGAPIRSGLGRGEAVRIATLLREAYRIDWSGR